MTYRNPALLRLAQLAPHCMAAGCRAPNDGQIVSAHSNQLRDGKGTGIKASDAMIAFLCDFCHRQVDQGSADGRERLAMWEDAHRRTMRWLIESGHLIVSGVPQLPEPGPLKSRKKISKGRPIQSRPFDKPAAPRKIASRGFPKRAK